MLLDLRKFRAGDPVTTQLILIFARAWARARLEKRSQIDAVVQDAMVEMMTKLEAGEMPEPESVERWIRGSLNNAFRRELTRLVRPPTEPYESEEHAAQPAQPSEEHRHRVDLEIVDAQLRAVSQRLQRMFVMRMQGYSHAEIALVMKAKPGTVRMSLARLRRRFIAELIGQQRINFEPPHDDDDSSATP